MTEIRNDIPAPKRSCNRNTYGHMIKMNVGESVLMQFGEEEGDGDILGSIPKLRSAATYWGKKMGMKFTTKRESDITIRLWRVK